MAAIGADCGADELMATLSCLDNGCPGNQDDPMLSDDSSVDAPDGAPARFYSAQSYCSDNSMGFLMKRLMLGLTGEVDRRLAEQGLTHAQWTPLFMLSKGRASTLAELARELQIDPGALTRTLDRLEAKGLCRRVRSTADRRVSLLELTDAGRQAVEQVPVVLSQVQNAYLSGFSEDEWLQLLGMLRRLLANADRFKGAAA
jgi:DNA-binding MarR family transcriptional regulator